MSEAELEAIILKEKEGQLSDDARYMLGKNLIEGCFPEKVKRNEKKRLNWIKQAVEHGHLPALEYKTYFDIRFEKHPSIEKIIKSLEICAAKLKSPRACATLAEFCHAKQAEEGNKEKAAQYYNVAAEQGCVVGMHWMGVYYAEGFGVTQNLDKAEAMLLKAQKEGNAQSAYQLYILYSSFPGKKDIVKAYRFLNKSVQLGVTNFDQQDKYFKENFDVLKPVFAEIRAPPAEMTDRKQIENLHDAYLNEMQETFSAKLGKDRMYQRAAGFVTDQQIWMIGVLMKYFLRKVMHYSHDDFMTAFKVDLGPLLGESGLWALRNYELRMKEAGKEDKKKKARNAIDLITEYLENGWDNLGKLTKYNLKNRYGPKKLPDQAVERTSVKHIYAWMHYAPLSFFQHTRKMEDLVGAAKSDGAPIQFNMCSYCGSPESQTIKHKRCSQCKQRLYCTSDCQKFDWKKGHNKECKTLAAQVPKSMK
jgi:TPR repeat protein